MRSRIESASRRKKTDNPRLSNRLEGSTVGIIADSHGQVDAIADALEFLNAKNCDHIFHLGDICDSLRPETSEACIKLLLDAGVTAIKGNNDHILLVNQSEMESPCMAGWAMDYLRKLPLVRAENPAVFAHSLPFERELGLSCMLGAIKPGVPEKIFSQFSKHILFRGHSHDPEIIWRAEGKIQSRRLACGETVDLKSCVPAIITCGALTRRLCMTWEPAERRVTCRHITSSNEFGENHER